MQQQRGAAEYDDNRATGNQHAVHLAMTEFDPGDLPQRCDDGDGGRAKNPQQLEGDEKQDDGEEIE